MRLRKSHSAYDIRNEIIKCQRILYWYRVERHRGLDPTLEEVANCLYRARTLLEGYVDAD